jgi:hypothetical protein
MKKCMYLMVFLTLASMAMATVGPVTSITVNTVPTPTPEKKYLLSITVGADTFDISKLATGTTTKGTTPVPTVDDLNMNTGTGGSPGDTVNFGGKDFFSTNGNKPDFFYFEGAGTGSGNPDDITVAPIFPNGTVGTAVAWPTTMAAGWGNCGLLSGNFQVPQVIAGVCWDITDMKDASGNFLSANAVIKGIRIGPDTVGIDPVMFIAAIPTVLRGQAHTPVPTDMATLIDPVTTTQVSWYSPEQDSSGAIKDDPNIVSVDGYKYWFGTVEPNEFTQTPITTTAQNFPVTLGYKTTYKWRVDTLVTWDSIAVTGKINDQIKGYTWQFRTQDPTLIFNGVITTQSLLPAALSASVLGFANPITTATFTLLADDVEFPADANAILTNTTTNLQTPTATLNTDKAGKYKVKLVVTDGIDTVEKIAEVLVYAGTDDCAAKKATGTWVKNYYDDNGSCDVDLNDFAVLARAWLNNTGYTTQQTYERAVSYVPQSIFNARIEAESVNQADPNGCSNYPITDTNGIVIDIDPTAMGGGKNLGGTANGFAQYTIIIPAAGTYDLHVYSQASSSGNVLSFGVEGTPALYGSVSGLPATGFAGNWHYTVHPGALTFAAAGDTIVRITWNATSRDLDWFTLVKQ